MSQAEDQERRELFARLRDLREIQRNTPENNTRAHQFLTDAITELLQLIRDYDDEFYPALHQ